MYLTLRLARAKNAACSWRQQTLMVGYRGRTMAAFITKKGGKKDARGMPNESLYYTERLIYATYEQHQEAEQERCVYTASTTMPTPTTTAQNHDDKENGEARWLAGRSKRRKRQGKYRPTRGSCNRPVAM